MIRRRIHRDVAGAPGSARRIRNPYLEEYQRWLEDPTAGRRRDWIRQYGFAIPDRAGLELIATHSPRGVVELGAGVGYWARLLQDLGVDVVAYDRHPPPSPENQWSAGAAPWVPVAEGDERAIARHSERTLLLVWPTRNEHWAAAAAESHWRGGGQHLVYVGEGPGGRTGDLVLHTLLGFITRCVSCSSGVRIRCTCDLIGRWRLVHQHELPSWDGTVQLYLFRRTAESGGSTFVLSSALAGARVPTPWRRSPTASPVNRDPGQ